MSRVFALLPLLLLAACGEDGTMGPGPAAPAPEATHHEISVKMSSISANEDCEDAAGNPGEFRYRLVVRKTDELGNQVLVGDSGTRAMTIDDGSVMGSTMEPIRFVLPREPGATFQVEYWLGEYDGNTADFENHSWVTHVYDRSSDREWEAGSARWQSYGQNDEGTYGIAKFTVWNTRATCKGFANYYVEWKPFDPDA